MAENNFKPRGQIKQSKPDAGGGVLRNLPVIGIVKNIIMKALKNFALALLLWIAFFSATILILNII